MDQQRRKALRTSFGLWLAATGLPASAADDDGRVIVAYDEDYAPYSYVENGAMKGIMPDILDFVLGRFEALQLVHTGRPWRRAQAEVKVGGADALCTFASEERLKYALASKSPVVLLQPHMFYMANSPARDTIERAARAEDLFGLHVLDLQGNQWAEQNLKIFPRITFIAALNNVFQMLSVGRGDVHISLSPVISRWRIKKLGLQGEKILSRPAPFIASDVPFSLLVRKTHPRAAQLVALYDAGMRKPGVGAAIGQIFQRYSA